jgi:oligopeptide transport system substrate-binding protein
MFAARRIAAIACIAAVTQTALAENAPAAAEIYRGAYGQPESLQPNQSGVKSEQTIMLDLFEGLTTFDTNGRVIAGAAESWQTSKDGKTWTFKLRPGLRWSDGSPLLAADWVYAWRRMFTPATTLARASRMFIIRDSRAVLAGRAAPDKLGVSAPDNRTLRIELENPLPWLPQLLAGQEGTPLPRNVVEKWGAQWTRPGNLVSNGAFRLAERRAGGTVRLVRNPYYRDAAQVRVDAIVYVPSDDTASLVNRFRAGELQINAWPGFAPRQQAALQAELGKAVRIAPLFAVRFLRFNVNRPPFDDVRVRRALSLLVDRELLVSKVLPGGEKPSYRVLPNGMSDDEAPPPSELQLGTAATRRDRARALLTEAAFKTRRPGPLRLRVPSGNGEEMCLAVAAMWTAAGVPTVVEKSEIKSMIADLRRGDFDVALTGSAENASVEGYLERFLADSSYNSGQYRNPAFEQALGKAQAMSDPVTRRRAVAGAEAILNGDHAVVPLIQEVARNLVAPTVGGWVDNPDDIHLSRYFFLQQSGMTLLGYGAWKLRRTTSKSAPATVPEKT